MARKKPQRVPFAQVVAALPDAPPRDERLFSYTVPMPWMTGAGGEDDRWHLRGEEYLETEALHAALRSDTQVFHFYMGKRREVTQQEREEFWSRAKALMAADPFAGFRGYEYENDARERCLVVYELC